MVVLGGGLWALRPLPSEERISVEGGLDISGGGGAFRVCGGRWRRAWDADMAGATLEATQGQIDDFPSQLPCKCHQKRVVSVEGGPTICPWVPSRVVEQVMGDAGTCGGRRSARSKETSTRSCPCQPPPYPTNRRPILPTDALSCQPPPYPANGLVNRDHGGCRDMRREEAERLSEEREKQKDLNSLPLTGQATD